MKFERFASAIASLGFPPKPILDFIRTLYVARELPYERG